MTIMKTIKGNITIFLACAFVFAVSAKASLCGDPNAMTGFTGTTSFDITVSNISLNADVEYAVYAPGTYPGKDLTGGSEYIYAYQIFNRPHTNVAIDFFSVGISSGVTIDNIYTDNTYGSSPGYGVDPLLSNIFAQSAGFIFAAVSLNKRECSNVLIFTSVLSPTMGFGTISGGGACVMAALPTPSVPEPATIVLLLPAFLIFTSNRRKIAIIK
jgi:hypothetical protein